VTYHYRMRTISRRCICKRILVQGDPHTKCKNCRPPCDVGSRCESCLELSEDQMTAINRSYTRLAVRRLNQASWLRKKRIQKGQEAQVKLRALESLLHLKSTQGTSLETLLLAEGIPIPPSVSQEEYIVFHEQLPSTSTGTVTRQGRSGEMSTERSTVDLLQSTVDGRHSTVDSRHATEEHDHQSTSAERSTVDRRKMSSADDCLYQDVSLQSTGDCRQSTVDSLQSTQTSTQNISSSYYVVSRQDDVDSRQLTQVPTQRKSSTYYVDSRQDDVDSRQEYVDSRQSTQASKQKKSSTYYVDSRQDDVDSRLATIDSRLKLQHRRHTVKDLYLARTYISRR